MLLPVPHARASCVLVIFEHVRHSVWLLLAAAVALKPVLSPLLLFCYCCIWQGPAAVPWGYSLSERYRALEPIEMEQTSLLRARKVQKWRRKRLLINARRRDQTYAGRGPHSGLGGANYISEITNIHMQMFVSFLRGESA